jgi:hypothetical protein
MKQFISDVSQKSFPLREQVTGGSITTSYSG